MKNSMENMHIDVKMFRIKVCSYFFFGLFLNRNKTNFGFLCSTSGRAKNTYMQTLFFVLLTLFLFLLDFRFAVLLSIQS